MKKKSKEKQRKAKKWKTFFLFFVILAIVYSTKFIFLCELDFPLRNYLNKRRTLGFLNPANLT
jgi:hypothetical protein